jgi:tetratricopeptide (TPR) repeat protein
MNRDRRTMALHRLTAALGVLVPAGLAGLVGLAVVGAIGCSSSGKASASPYATPSESDRSTVRAEALTRKAVALMDGDPAEAESILREALVADLYHGPAHNNLGVLYLRQGELYEAANEFEWARKVMPGHPDPRFNLAMTLERAGRTDEALAMYDTAIEVYGEHMPSMQAIARLQVKRGDVDARTREFLDEIALRGETERWREWAKAAIGKASGIPTPLGARSGTEDAHESLAEIAL